MLPGSEGETNNPSNTIEQCWLHNCKALVTGFIGLGIGKYKKNNQIKIKIQKLEETTHI